MNIFGIGPLEILFIILIGILVLGPEGMVETGRKLGQFIHSVVTSKWWRSVQSGVDEVQNLPHKLMREAEIQEWNELYKIDEKDFPTVEKNSPLGRSSWRGPSGPPVTETEDE
jgi:Sec-independent protein translocase protein TatA